METLAIKTERPVIDFVSRIVAAKQFQLRMKAIVDMVDSEIICHPLLKIR